jgi:O-antigen/teichoic acid export membrane protein/choline kinase
VTESPLITFVRNVGTRYLGLAVNVVIGLLLLPVNLAYLGPAAYGLWMLTASVTTYFTVFDLGYGGAIIKFVAEYRAKKDPQALNEVLSTTFFLFCGIGVACYIAAVILSFFLPAIFNLAPEQGHAAQVILLIVGFNVAIQFPFSIYGGVVNGFQRYYLNNVIGTASNVLAAVANVLVLWNGGGVIEVVALTTIVRVAPYLLYLRNARAVFPAMELRLSLFRKARLREVTGFSIYIAVIDWAARLNYTVDTLVIGMFMNTTAVAVYAVAQRLSEALLRLTHQLHVFLFPAVVHSEVTGDRAQQVRMFVHASRFQLAVSVALCGALAAVADTLIPVWLGRGGFEESALLAQLLAYVVVVRAWTAMPGMILKGTGRPKFVAVTTSWCALANVLLSIGLVQLYGLVGVAMGTVIPVTVFSAAVLFPAGCHRRRRDLGWLPPHRLAGGLAGGGLPRRLRAAACGATPDAGGTRADDRGRDRVCRAVRGGRPGARGAAVVRGQGQRPVASSVPGGWRAGAHVEGGVMKGVILAAGRGSRLNGGNGGVPIAPARWGANGDMPKCLVTVGGETLLSRNIRVLRDAGIDDIVVVVGCAADTVRRTVPDVTFVENAIFSQTNSLYSLWLAQAHLIDGFVVMNCDVLVDPQLVTDLLTAAHEDALLLAYREPGTDYGDEEMKVTVRCGRVVDISKTMDPAAADGENLGIVKFGARGARLLIEKMDALVAAGEIKAWVPRAFKEFAGERPLHVIGTRGLPWIEIDFPEDYRRAVEVVLPQIDSSQRVAKTA